MSETSFRFALAKCLQEPDNGQENPIRPKPAASHFQWVARPFSHG